MQVDTPRLSSESGINLNVVNQNTVSKGIENQLVTYLFSLCSQTVSNSVADSSMLARYVGGWWKTVEASVGPRLAWTRTNHNPIDKF